MVDVCFYLGIHSARRTRKLNVAKWVYAHAASAR
jgi:hypothetical protein